MIDEEKRNIKQQKHICQNPVCGKEFWEYKSNIRPAKFCSNHCKGVCQQQTKETRLKRSESLLGKTIGRKLTKNNV